MVDQQVIILDKVEQVVVELEVIEPLDMAQVPLEVLLFQI